MPTPLESALVEVQAEIDTYNIGTPQQPLPGSFDYFMLRSLLTGQALLLRLQTLGIEADVAASERLYRRGTMHFGAAEVPPEVVVPVEKLPDGVVVPAGVPVP